MEEKHKHHHIGAWVLILLGLFFLLNNFGVLPWTVWAVLWRFWPVLLVLFGLRLVLGRRSNAFGIIALVILLLIILWALVLEVPSFNLWARRYMPWMPMSQMMDPNNQNQNLPFRMYRKGMMFDNGSGSNYFYNQTPNNSLNY